METAERRGQIGGHLAPGESSVDEDRKLRFGMGFYVVNDMILAIFFIGSYIFLRGYDTNLRWFPPGVGQPPYIYGFWVMIIAVAGAIAFGVGEWALGRGMQTPFRWLIALAALIYLIDLAAQVWVLGHLPFTVQDGAFATAYIMLSGYHVYHMALGVFLGIGLTNRAFQGKYLPSARRPIESPNEAMMRRGGTPAARAVQQHHHTGVRAIGYYWYWVAIYAIAFWLLVIIQPPTHP